MMPTGITIIYYVGTRYTVVEVDDGHNNSIYFNYCIKSSIIIVPNMIVYLHIKQYFERGSIIIRESPTINRLSTIF